MLQTSKEFRATLNGKFIIIISVCYKKHNDVFIFDVLKFTKLHRFSEEARKTYKTNVQINFSNDFIFDVGAFEILLTYHKLKINYFYLL